MHYTVNFEVVEIMNNFSLFVRSDLGFSPSFWESIFTKQKEEIIQKYLNENISKLVKLKLEDLKIN